MKGRLRLTRLFYGHTLQSLEEMIVRLSSVRAVPWRVAAGVRRRIGSGRREGGGDGVGKRPVLTLFTKESVSGRP